MMLRYRQVPFVLLYTALGILGTDLESLLDTVGLDSSLSITTHVGEAIYLSIASSEWLDLGFNVTMASSNPPWLSYNHSDTVLSGFPGNKDVGSKKMSFQISQNNTCSPEHLHITVTVQKKRITQDSCKFRPIKKKPINHISAISGQLYHYRVRDDVFEDEEDGSTHHLQLSLSLVRSINSRSDTSWLLLDTANQILFGLPMESEYMETEVVGLRATDSCGLGVTDAITVRIYADRSPHYKFLMNFDRTFKNVIQKKFYRYKLVSDIEYWLKRRIQVFEINSVNNSLTWALQDDVFDDKCNDTIVNNIFRNLTYENETSVTEEFRCHLSPYFQVQNVHFIHKDGCYEFAPHDSTKKNAHSDFRYWLEVILPAIIFLVLFVVLVIFLYFYCNRRRKTRGRYIMSVDQSNFIEERQPVILQTDNPDDDPSLKPRYPIIITNVDGTEGQDSSGIEIRERPAPAPPEVVITADASPPQYRLPPPYNSQHQFW